MLIPMVTIIPVIWMLIGSNVQGPFPLHFFPDQDACQHTLENIKSQVPEQLQCVKYVVDGKNV